MSANIAGDSMQRRHLAHQKGAGLSFTELGFGTAPLGNLYRAISADTAQAVLQAAWDAGVRFFDTAPLYGLGLSETRLNRFLRDKPRNDYVISTKIGRRFQVATPGTRDGLGKWFDVPSRREIFDYSHDGVLRSLEMSLERLGLDRVDILHVHDLDLFTHKTQPVLDDQRAAFMAGGYKALVRLRDEGVIRAFGAGVNEAEQCDWLLARGDFDLFLLAGHYTLLEQDALDSFLPNAAARRVGVVLGAPYNSGILASGARPGAFFRYEPASEAVLARVRRLEAVCARHAVRLVDAAFRFPLGHPSVVSVIPGGQGVAEAESNARAAQARLPAALWHDMQAEGLIRPDAPLPDEMVPNEMAPDELLPDALMPVQIP